MSLTKTTYCGLLRREANGHWYYGERLVGIDGEPIPGALELALADTADAPSAEPPAPLKPAVQLSLDWPVEAPVIAIDEGESLAKAHRQVWAELDRGAFCPCCQRTARRYPRKLHAEMAAFLVRLVKAYEKEKRWHHLREVIPGGEEVPKASTDGAYLTAWGLVKRHPDRAGFYRPTPGGTAFVRGRTSVPRIAWIYDGRASHFSNEMVTIRQALTEQFDLLSMLSDREGPGGDR